MNHSETITIECTINGMPFQLHAAPGTPLSELLREQGLLSVKQGCCVGECGACTVVVDGTARDSCVYLAAWAEGKEIRTLEGEAKGGKLSHVQQALSLVHMRQKLLYSVRKSYIFLMDRFLFLASYRNLQKPAGLK